MRRFLVVIERSESGTYGAYSPDIPGCVAVGATKEEAEQLIYEAIEFHLQGLTAEGLPVPDSQSTAEYVLMPEVA